MTMGNSLVITLLTIRLHEQDISTWLIGLVSASYYLGFLLGGFRIERFIVRVGMIRAYATFGSVLAVSIMLHGLWTSPWIWIFLRIIGGYCIAGLYIVIEGWLISRSTVRTRGQILAFYSIALYGSQAIGQYLLTLSNPQTLIPFCIATIFCALSVVPLSMTYVESPNIEEPSALSLRKLFNISPTGVLATLCAGLILGAVYGMMPLFLAETNHSVDQVAMLMSITIFGGMALQYPIGRLSDYIERRIVIISVSLIAVVCSLGIITFGETNITLLAIMLFLLGGMIFPIYPLAISHACDVLDRKDFIAATQGLVFVYGLGAVFGPVTGSGFIKTIGPIGLFYFFILICILLVLFSSYRRIKRKIFKISDEEKQGFVSVPQTTPVGTELDPRQDDDELVSDSD